MQSKHLQILLIVTLILFTFAVMAYSSRVAGFFNASGRSSGAGAAEGIPVTVTARLVQDKVLYESDGRVTLQLDLTAAEVLVPETAAQPVDMVVVLDRSGSMQGAKIQKARQAAVQLVDQLTARDRLALVSYADGVITHSVLLPVTPANRRLFKQQLNRLAAGGSTNLGGGLQTGLDLMQAVRGSGRAGRVLLISDGLANRGVTAPMALAQLAGRAISGEFGVSTAGVGSEFNEQLMALIADHGAGNYYYLENANAFAEVFQKEFQTARNAVASKLAVRMTLTDGVQLVDAAGYPISQKGSQAVFYPGNLHSGQSRQLFLTFKVPTHEAVSRALGNLQVDFTSKDQDHQVQIPRNFQVACVKERRQVMSSIKKDAWEDKVLKNDYSRLKNEVAADIKSGRKEKALQRIRTYQQDQTAANASVGSAKVQQNLEVEVRELEAVVNDSFAGPAPEAAMKQKKAAKKLQYQGYKGQRSLTP